MIRAALGGVVALLGLLVVWHWMLGRALPEALGPERATVRTLDLPELLGSAAPAALDRRAASVPEETLPPPDSFAEGEDAAPAPEPEPVAIAPPPEEPVRDAPVDAALIRRMLSVYARTAAAR